VFSAFMTGNVVFLAAGLFSHQSELSLHAALALCAFGVGAWATALVMPRQRPGVLWPARVTTGLVACALVQLVFWVVWPAVGGHPGSTLALLLAHLRLWMPLLPVLLTSGVAVAAHQSVEQYADPTQTTVSAAPHQLNREFGRSPGEPPSMPHGR
jgi:uncharacterized membrane protein YoaK (UPF0700 family)